MIFFEKVTKHIAFARDFRYTVTRIAPAICGFCALLPKQLTPRQGTKTIIKCAIFAIFMKQLTPRQGTKTHARKMQLMQTWGNNLRPVRGRKLYHLLPPLSNTHETTYAPSGDENTTPVQAQSQISLKQLTPRQGTKTNFARTAPARPSETTYTPPGDENFTRCSEAAFSSFAKQLTPRQGTKTYRQDRR